MLQFLHGVNKPQYCATAQSCRSLLVLWRNIIPPLEYATDRSFDSHLTENREDHDMNIHRLEFLISHTRIDKDVT
jgi:hypothetical protein